MRLRSQPVASLVLAAAATFTGSLIIRTLDIPACHWTEFLGKSLGTHFAWHALNACTLFILIQATCHHEAHR
jgi:hypothetical protein